MAKQLYVVGVDGSEWSKRAVNRAISLAAETGADVNLVYAYEYTSGNPLATKGIIPDSVDKVAEEKNIIDTILQPMVESAATPSVKASCVVLWGEPVEKIHYYVKETKASMLFVGRRGRSRIADLVLGSVANKLAHYSGIPVVLVP
ncbi:universal stress protein [Thalassotalea piscium]|uniref:Nucleotide-binding universal stress UspA family protein n=1 Tax=Thalassotalea piscium TaxID=1230533 RepID=A0A7X0NF69_9GAMM|nr:universal stress protein [Thalassotalea piscium]MBB6542337.1 nucleotide-binding universal stress UspA family protein [Thalassotalea piscium]